MERERDLDISLAEAVNKSKKAERNWKAALNWGSKNDGIRMWAEYCEAEKERREALRRRWENNSVER